MCDQITGELLRQIISDWANTMEAKADYLTQLDVPIGDGDHGRNMALGFQTVREKMAAEVLNTPGVMLRFTGMTLVATVGGASGPLYGAAFVAAGVAVRSTSILTINDLARMLRAAADALARRGRCRIDDKTILDALEPAARALEEAATLNHSPIEGLQAAAGAARRGMLATVPMVARRGLAMQYGPASAGHQDPGATSCYLLLDSAVRTIQRHCTHAR
jgi:phosphoenolpyruvate---glycerone phosphotransferase subunit DhaL